MNQPLPKILKSSAVLTTLLILSTNVFAQFMELTTPTINNLIDVVALNDTVVYACGGQNTIIRSTDGGQNWVGIPSGTNTDYEIIDLEFADPLNAFAVKYSDFTDSAIIVKTSNAWGSSSLSLITDTAVIDINFPSTSVGYIVGEQGMMKKTNNLGNSWVDISANLGTTKALSSVHFTDDLTGFVVDMSGKLYRTFDGGASWDTTVSINTQEPDTSFYDIVFSSPDTGFILGISNIYVTSDGGSSWVHTYVSSEGLIGIDAANDDVVAAVGQSGSFLISNTFQVYDTNLVISPQTFKGISFANPSLAYIVGAGGKAYKYIRADIEGEVQTQIGDPFSTGAAILFRKYNVAGKFDTVQIQALDGSGIFGFHDLFYGKYVVLIVPGIGVRDDFHATYPDSAIRWIDANEILLTEDQFINVWMKDKPQSTSSGPGRIAGFVREADSTGKRGPGDPLNGIDVFLISKDNGNQIHDVEVTDDHPTIGGLSGYYKFENLPIGSYSIQVDVPGVAPDTSSSNLIQITETDTVIDSVNVSVDSTAIAVVVPQAQINSIFELPDGANVLDIYPNPASDYIQVVIPVDAILEEVRIYSVSGTLIQSEHLNYRGDGISSIPIDLTHLPGGMYIIDIQAKSSDGQIINHHAKLIRSK